MTSAVEQRLQKLEDEREISRIISAYGPLVDAGKSDEVAALWVADGVYDVDELFMGDQEAIEEMVDSDAHQGLIRSGCAHIQGTPHITLDADNPDRAWAFCYSMLVVHHEGRFHPVRVGANRWEFVRTDAGWRVQRRVVRKLDGTDEARALLELA